MASNGLIENVQYDTIIPTFLIKIQAHTGMRYHALLPTLFSSSVHLTKMQGSVKDYQQVFVVAFFSTMLSLLEFVRISQFLRITFSTAFKDAGMRSVVLSFPLKYWERGGKVRERGGVSIFRSARRRFFSLASAPSLVKNKHWGISPAIEKSLATRFAVVHKTCIFRVNLRKVWLFDHHY